MNTKSGIFTSGAATSEKNKKKTKKKTKKKKTKKKQKKTLLVSVSEIHRGYLIFSV